MGTDIRRTTSIDRLSKRALAFDMEHSEVDGMNVLSVHKHVKKLVDNMRKKQRPHLLEALTYRYRGHSVSDPGNYRTKDEVKRYQKLDPIIQLGDYLLDQKLATKEKLEEWDEQARARAREVEKFADESPQPDPALGTQHNYV